VGGLYPGRFTAAADGPFVVFVLGMRINRVWQPHHWMPPFRAMLHMQRALQRQPGHGFLSGELLLFWRGMAALQYWQSFDALEAFASDPAAPHLPAWRWFQQARQARSGVGVWHETYQIMPGGYEAIYINMPRFGLAGAARHLPIASAAAQRARGRMTGG